MNIFKRALSALCRWNEARLDKLAKADVAEAEERLFKIREMRATQEEIVKALQTER